MVSAMHDRGRGGVRPGKDDLWREQPKLEDRALAIGLILVSIAILWLVSWLASADGWQPLLPDLHQWLP